MLMSGIGRLSVVFLSRCATRMVSFSTCSAFTALLLINSNKESSGAWMGEPTDQRLMLVRRIS